MYILLAICIYDRIKIRLQQGASLLALLTKRWHTRGPCWQNDNPIQCANQLARIIMARIRTSIHEALPNNNNSKKAQQQQQDNSSQSLICDLSLDWFHNLCMLLRADLSLIQRLVAKQCLKSDLFDSLVFIIIACLKFGPRN